MKRKIILQLEHLIMLEVMNELQEFEESMVQKDKYQARELKLPKIQRLPSRGVPKEVKSSTKLPTLRSQTAIDPPEAQTERRSIDHEDFVGQVEKKLRMIMEEQNILEIDESCENDEDDFQKKINQNKELLKYARKQNQKLRKQNEVLNRVANNFNPARKPSHKTTKNQGYDKRMKEYKESNFQNRGIIKKKDTLTAGNKNVMIKDVKDVAPKSSTLLKQSNGNKDLREVKSKDQLAQVNKINVQNKPGLQFFQGRKMAKHYSHKFLSPLQKNEQLFDAIHNYLDNPRRAEQEFNSQKIIKEKNELEQKLKSYEERLNQHPQCIVRHKESTKSQMVHIDSENNPGMASAKWRKIGLDESHGFLEETSTFDKEMERIGRYLQRNQKSIEKYVQNQKILMDVQNAKRQNSRDRNLEKQSSI